MSRAGAQLASRLDLAALANVAAKSGEILVINVTDVIGAVLAHLAATREAASSAATWATGATASATWATAAFAAAVTTRATTALATSLGTAETAWASFPIFVVL